MRLIRNREVVNMTLQYWHQQEQTMITLERYLIYRTQAREFATKLYAFYESIMYNTRHLLQTPPDRIKVLNNDPKLWLQYANIVSQAAVVLPAHVTNLKKQEELAVQLMNLIQKKYF